MTRIFDSKSFGDAIVDYRTKKELSIRQAASLCGVAANTIFKCEVGKFVPKVSDFWNICVSMSFKPDRFFNLKTTKKIK